MLSSMAGVHNYSLGLLGLALISDEFEFDSFLIRFNSLEFVLNKLFVVRI